MRRLDTFAPVVLVALFLVISPSVACAMDVNEFYRTFVERLKASQYGAMEQLVRENPDDARQVADVLRKRIAEEKELVRREAFTALLGDLDEVMAVTSGREDCKLSEALSGRAKLAPMPEKRAELYRRSAILCPGNRKAMLGLAEMDRRSGRFEEAVAGYEKVLAVDKEDAEALLGLCEALYAAGLYERAVPLVNAVLAQDSHNRAAKSISRSLENQIAQDTDSVMPRQEIALRLRSSLGSNPMCMCPARAKVTARVRFRSITFATDSTDLNGKARAQLAQLAKAFETEALKGGRYVIEGHADPVGAKEYNAEISATRAETVRRHLVDVLKVRSVTASATGFGASRPWTDNDTAAHRRANRRIEVIRLDPAAGAN